MTGDSRRPARIVTIAAAIDPSGAVSRHLTDTCKALAEMSGWEVRLLARRWEECQLPARLVSGVAELLLDRDFLSADLLIYHFAGWDPLFNALVVGNGHARQAVFVYPLKPVELAAAKERHLVARSLVQLNTLRQADRLWPTSPASAALLAARGFDQARIELFPLPGCADPSAAPIEPLRPERIDALIRDRVAALLPAGAGTASNSPDRETDRK